MKLKKTYAFAAFLCVLVAAIYCNWHYEVIAVHPFYGDDQYELKVMTWNVHCPDSADCKRQRGIAELILKEDADFVLLNEYKQDSCQVMDSLLKMRYPFTEECRSHRRSGDIFYSRREMSNSGYVVRITKKGKRRIIKTIKATIAIGCDSVQIFGLHLASNHYDGSTIEEELQSDTSSYVKYKDAQELRCAHAHWTKEAALHSEHPVVIMGDMNDFSRSAPLDTFTINGFRDSWWEGGNGYGHTFHSGWMRLRIDHILHSEKLELKSIKVIGTDLSDHNPLVAGFCTKK